MDRFQSIEAKMNSSNNTQEIIALSKEYSELKPIAEAIMKLQEFQKQESELKTLIETETDQEMTALMKDEIGMLNQKISDLEKEVQILLIPKDKDDNASVVLEIRAGTGGDEAALFAGDLMRMYQYYAQSNKWRVEIVSQSVSDMGGYKEIIANISGEGVYEKLKFESGVHRVQRVPITETQGRVHTSAATVAVLPEPEDIDLKIEDKDLRIDVFRASGPGGQSVNTTDSAVRITHLPTGLVVSQQDEKSQHKNKEKALKILKARLYELERSKREQERAENRKGQIGSGDRSERIRTYNFPQGRVTDHRINLTLYKLDKIIQGEDLDEIINVLSAEDRAIKLTEMDELS